MLEEVFIHGKFNFRFPSEITWEYKKENDSEIVMYLPIKKDLSSNYKGRNLFKYSDTILCHFRFTMVSKEIELKASILHHEGMQIKLGKDGAEVLVISLNKLETSRFMKCMAWADRNKMKKTEVRIPMQKRPKRKEGRIPKNFHLYYTVELNSSDLNIDHRINLAGETIDVSKKGMFIKSEFLPPLGSKVKVNLKKGEGNYIEIVGEIVRRVDNTPNSGFALEIANQDNGL